VFSTHIALLARVQSDAVNIYISPFHHLYVEVEWSDSLSRKPFRRHPQKLSQAIVQTLPSDVLISQLNDLLSLKDSVIADLTEKIRVLKRGAGEETSTLTQMLEENAALKRKVSSFEEEKITVTPFSFEV
jgi:hypothetical protein